MTHLDSYLADLNAPQIHWFKATILADDDGFLTLMYAHGNITNAVHLEQYTPQIGDVVHVLSFEPMGVLVLGTTSASSPGLDPFIPQTPQVFTANGTATWNQALGTWTSGTLIQGTSQVACFFYTPSVFSGLLGTSLQQVEVEITRASGGPPAFVSHLNLNTATALSMPGDMVIWRPDVVLPTGVPTWVPLPIGWGQDLVSGNIKGIGIWTELDTAGVYSGTGRVRLTPLSVTI